ncbi:MAG: PASTA domain-containing protein [Gemmatimonas sp.]|nr:PASTA domain-containing protein [Gemmatimonas sp.]
MVGSPSRGSVVGDLAAGAWCGDGRGAESTRSRAGHRRVRSHDAGAEDRGVEESVSDCELRAESARLASPRRRGDCLSSGAGTVSRATGKRGGGWSSARTVRRGVVASGFLLAGTVIAAKAAMLQIVQHERWSAAAEEQHRERVELPARRGGIYDRNGVALALSEEMFRVSLAPQELRDPGAVAERIAAGLGRPPSEMQDIVESSDRWVVLPGRYTSDQRREVGNLRGVYFESQLERFYPQGDAGREVIGALARDGRALGGIEQELDEVLRGQPGYSVLRRDAGGRMRPTMSLPVVPPTEGASVYLTIDSDLQEIADASLSQAIRETGSSGGDLLIGDPDTGEVLAAVSRRSGRSRSLAAITAPYEPGSTIKPFVAAALLTEGRATLSDSVYAEQGFWRDGSRAFRDTSPHGWLSLRSTIEVSSNIAIAKFAKRLSAGQQYAYLRDFGFGTLTGIAHPAESSGLLRRPREWSKLSSGSLAMGYELLVTPLQMLAAYGALANGGVLMEPTFIREVRGPDGRSLARREPVQLRRVVSEEVARSLTDVLAATVNDGTATQASLGDFAVAGKTGTSRRVVDGGYRGGGYTSTFAGYFPAEDPQIVLFVKLDEPQGEYYGGVTAAPVTRETLRGILAARTPGIDRRTLLTARIVEGPRSSPLTAWPSGHGDRDDTYVFELSPGLPRASAEEIPTSIAVPAVVGQELREAARQLHDSGFKVRVEGRGRVTASVPPAGSLLEPGVLVTIRGGGA